MAQRQLIKSQQVGLQIGLVAALRDERYEPRATCPRCGRKLEPNEILAGFSRDVNDFTTGCTGCHHRFEPRLICFGTGWQIEIPFFCGVQARDRLRNASLLSPSEIARQFPGEYRSAVIHFGTLKALFLSMKIEYDHIELEEWQGRVMPFLGKMPDTVIAKCVGTKDATISRLRRDHNIAAYNKRKALCQAGVA
jgi:hypothetical protein